MSNWGLMLGVGKTPIPLLCNISVSFKICGYSPISPIGCVKVNICYIHREWLNPKVSDNALNLICKKGKSKFIFRPYS